MIQRQSHAETKLSVVFEKRVAPRRTTTVFVLRVRRGRQVSAVDARTTSGVRDDRSIAEKLRHQLDVRRFPTTRARAGELEQRLEQLNVLHRIERDKTVLVQVGQLEEVVPVHALAVTQRQLRLHVE